MRSLALITKEGQFGSSGTACNFKSREIFSRDEYNTERNFRVFNKFLLQKSRILHQTTVFWPTSFPFQF